MKIIALLLSWLAWAGPSQAQPTVPSPRDANVSCITALELPTRGVLAVSAKASGTVNARIHIGSGGQASHIELAGGDSSLRGEVRVAIEQSVFSARCHGRIVELVFAFTLEEDPPTDAIIPPAVRFLPPNRFDLIFRRVKPNLDPGRPLGAPATAKEEPSAQ